MVIVEDVGVAQPSRWLVVVTIASVHDAERSSLRASEALAPLSNFPKGDVVVFSKGVQAEARCVAIEVVRVASVVLVGACIVS